jgi:hypothetical protein
MATFHVIPRGDAVTHATHGTDCECVVEVKTYNAEEPGRFDVWVYHHRVTLDEALASSPAPADEAA